MKPELLIVLALAALALIGYLLARRDIAEIRRRNPERRAASPEIRSTDWMGELEAALRHIKTALDIIGGRSDTLPLIVHKAETELQRAIETERRSSPIEKLTDPTKLNRGNKQT